MKKLTFIKGDRIMEMRDETYLKDRFLHPDLRAGGWIRLLALFYDIALLGMFLFMFAGATTLWMMISTETPYIGDPMRARQYILENEFHLFIINWVILGAVFIFYQYLYPCLKRQTFGMLFTDLTLVDENRQKITKLHYLKRECLKIVLFPTFFLAFGKERRTFYDKLSKTYLMK